MDPCFGPMEHLFAAISSSMKVLYEVNAKKLKNAAVYLILLHWREEQLSRITDFVSHQDILYAKRRPGV